MPDGAAPGRERERVPTRRMSSHLQNELEADRIAGERAEARRPDGDAAAIVRRAASATTRFVRCHPLPVAVVAGIATAGVLTRAAALRRSRPASARLRDLLDADAAEELVERIVERSGARASRLPVAQRQPVIGGALVLAAGAAAVLALALRR